MENNWLIELEKIFGQENVSTEESAVREKSLDCWPRNLFLTFRHRKSGSGRFSTAAAIVKAEHNYYLYQIKELVHWAKRHDKKIIVRGGGSGVCGAANAAGGEIILDTTNLNKMELISRPDKLQPGVVMVESGVFGDKLDNFLKNLGLTCGHYPASLNVSTVGGWVSTGASGQYSFYFGNIENIVQAVEGINGLAEIVRLEGDKLKKVLRMEGTTLIITKVWLKVVGIPAHNLFQSFQFNRSEDLANFLRVLPYWRNQLALTGIKFYSVRAYDYLDFNFISQPHRGNSPKPRWLEKAIFLAEKQVSRFGQKLEKIVENLEKRRSAPWTCLTCLASDDSKALTEGAAKVEQAAKNSHGRIIDPTLAQTWHENRFKLSYEKITKRFQSGLIVDTFDCRPYWYKVAESYQLIRHKFFEHGLVGAHFGLDLDQPYIYFTFAFPATNKEKYDQVCREVLDLCAKNFIFTTHHHGIGQAKRGLAGTLTTYAYGVHWLKDTALSAKKELDPDNIFNPANNF